MPDAVVSLTFMRHAVRPALHDNIQVYALTHPAHTYPVPSPYGTDKVLYGSLVFRTVSKEAA